MNTALTTQRFSCPYAVVLCCWLTNSLAIAAERDRSADTVFDSEVRPILERHCFECHSHDSDTIKAGLILETTSSILVGGDSGTAVHSGEPQESLLLTAILQTDPDLKMPPKGNAVPREEIDVIRKWILDSTDWPFIKTVEKTELEFDAEDRSWWAIQPIRQPTPPELENDTWSKNEIDKFVLKRMRAAGIDPAPEADRSKFVRRLVFDLTGLPPRIQDVEKFVQDTSPNALEHLVDRTLLSPRYGERWAQHWLDLVRYADSDGYRADYYRPLAFRYRDYVIRAFNDGKPYDRFIAEQIAGDEIAPTDPDAITATSFLRLWMYEYNNRDVEGQWRTILNDITDTTGDVFLGVGLRCARCHDHKFDPILQKDYYRLQAYFAAILPRDDVPAVTPVEFFQHRADAARWESKTAGLRQQIRDIRKPYEEKLGGQIFEKFSEEYRNMMNMPKSERTPYERQIGELAYRQVLNQHGSRADGVIKGKDLDELQSLRKTLAAFESMKPTPMPIVMSATDVGPFAPSLQIPKKPHLGEIDPGPLSIIDPEPATVQRVPSAPNSTGRRAELARWLTSRANPLTARVMANRIWQYHFGRGLSANPSDFGRLGHPPTHPELLDWLASQFVAQGWSIKRLNKLIVTSATYRQSTIHPDHTSALTIDPDNELLWHVEIRRLDAEQIRDAMLLASGQLNFRMGGSAVKHSEPRRSIYTQVRRNTRHPFLEAFDYPDRQSSVSDRSVTTTPNQSLKMINGEFTLNCAEAMAIRLRETGHTENPDAVKSAYQIALGRDPSHEERRAALEFIDQQESIARSGSTSPKRVPFIADKMQFRDAVAARMTPDSTQSQFEARLNKTLSLDQFSIEAFIELKSVYESGSVRTIAAQWNGDKSAPGWSFGVTGRESRFKPQHLVLQLTTQTEEGSQNHEPVFSNLEIELNRPYYVAATVALGADEERKVAFYVKDLTEEVGALDVDIVTHRIAGPLHCNHPVVIGGRHDQDGHFFDGLIDDVRYSDIVLPADQLLFRAELADEHTVGFWQFESEQNFHFDRSKNSHHLTVEFEERKPVIPEHAALEDFCHALLNSNEFLYVD